MPKHHPSRPGFRLRPNREAGLTLVELAVVCAIVFILTAAAIPVFELGILRSREVELRRALHTIRTAIDRYYDMASIGALDTKLLEPDDMFYPNDLDVLLDVLDGPPESEKTYVILQRLPRDPMADEDMEASETWGKRSYQDDFDSSMWGQENVYDVYSLSDGIALDGTEYSTW